MIEAKTLLTRKILLLFFVIISNSAFSQTNLKLWYDKPARNWNEALPVGNGRLGAMIFGNVNEELIQLNEETLWSGGPANTNANPHAVQYLPQIRKALEEENYKLAEEIAQKMQGLFTESYLPLGDLVIKQDLKGSPASYYRDLNISDATATTKFKIDGIEYTREIFVSAPDQVIVIKLTASKKGALNFSASTKSQLFVRNSKVSDDEIALKGVAPSHIDPSYVKSMTLPIVYGDPSDCRGMRFELRMKAKTKDGQITTDDAGLRVEGATEAVLYLSAATSFNGFDKCPDKEGKDENKAVENYMSKAFAKEYEVLKRDHINDYRKFFDRVSLTLNGNPEVKIPTNERLGKYAEGAKDSGLEVLYYQFGRYLLISSSRPGGIPANLQGIWNPHLRAPWSSNFTTNINAQMNYWMVETANLSELHQPLIDLIKSASITGKDVTRNFYNANGWTAHHNVDIWASTNPASGSPSWANWPMGGAWLSQHLWEHYQFTGDKKYLQETAYPLMKSSAEFLIDWLIEDKNGHLITSPSTSPENVFLTETGEKGTVSVATTMDMSITWDLFTNLIQASEQLGIDEEFRKLIQKKRAKLFPLQIGKKGNLQEWYKDWEDSDPQHRHISHLFGLFPGRQISPVNTPQYAQAVRKSMELRGDGGTGWSKGWKINIWARLLDGNHAHKLIREQLKLTGVEGTDYANGGGTYPNLLDAHPPFQIDGNFGGASGITEMLLQSQDGAINILPALPDEWSFGKVTGLKARGGYTIDITWKNGKVTELKVNSALGGNCRLSLKTPLKQTAILKKAQGENPNPFYKLAVSTNEKIELVENRYDIQTEPGKSYVFTGI
jgi:alpha-L-fucosidase 2